MNGAVTDHARPLTGRIGVTQPHPQPPWYRVGTERVPSRGRGVR